MYTNQCYKLRRSPLGCCNSGVGQSSEFKTFLTQLVPRLKRAGIINECTLIYDNAAIHHAEVIEEFLDGYGVNYIYLSRCGYMLNPIEFCFGKIKAFVRNRTALGPSLDLPDTTLGGSIR